MNLTLSGDKYNTREIGYARATAYALESSETTNAKYPHG